MSVVRIDSKTPERAVILEAAARLREGRLVAFPTETVYGLGANALDPEAIDRIYRAKGRPAYNPLIVHVVDAEGARMVASAWPERAQALADQFWPGPLTLVLPKRPNVPTLLRCTYSRCNRRRSIRQPKRPAGNDEGKGQPGAP